MHRNHSTQLKYLLNVFCASGSGLAYSFSTWIITPDLFFLLLLKCKDYCSGISELSVRDYLEILTFRDGGLSACQGWNP